jgi:hypothetical protein
MSETHCVNCPVVVLLASEMFQFTHTQLQAVGEVCRQDRTHRHSFRHKKTIKTLRLCSWNSIFSLPKRGSKTEGNIKPNRYRDKKKEKVQNTENTEKARQRILRSIENKVRNFRFPLVICSFEMGLLIRRETSITQPDQKREAKKWDKKPQKE